MTSPNSPENSGRYLVALEGGGSHSQAAVIDPDGHVLHVSGSSAVNTNFVSFQDAQEAVWQGVSNALDAAGVPGEQVNLFVSALVGPRFGAELFGSLLPNARYRYYDERDVVFARAGIYTQHGAAVVSATGATAWAVRADDGRRISLGGWGSLLGDEGSAYAAGLLGMRAAVKAFEGRAEPTGLVDALCQHFGIRRETFQHGMVRLAYQKPLNRTEIAALAVLVTQLAGKGDPAACRIIDKVSTDLTNLALHAARRLFHSEETFPVAAAGGLFNAGPMVIQPLQEGLSREFPNARLILGSAEPAVALGMLALDDIIHNRRNHAD
jgi:N-acetylglucosamine kinase-like BadF-type ATPase